MDGSIYEKLASSRQRVINEIKNLKEQELNVKPDPESWSIAQVCHHLVLVELATIQMIKRGLENGKQGEAERKDVSIAQERTNKLKAPRAVLPGEGAFHKQQLLDMFANSRNQLIWTLQGIEDKSVLKKISVPHPSFGKLTLDQWVEFIPYHELRHLEQIKEILEKIR